MSNSSDEESYCQNSKFNKHVLKLADNYSALLKIQLQDKLRKLKDGAYVIAKNSNNPKLLRVCKELEKLKIK